MTLEQKSGICHVLDSAAQNYATSRIKFLMPWLGSHWSSADRNRLFQELIQAFKCGSRNAS